MANKTHLIIDGDSTVRMACGRTGFKVINPLAGHEYPVYLDSGNCIILVSREGHKPTCQTCLKSYREPT